VGRGGGGQDEVGGGRADKHARVRRPCRETDGGEGRGGGSGVGGVRGRSCVGSKRRYEGNLRGIRGGRK